MNTRKENRIVIVYRLAKKAFGNYKKNIVALIGLGFLGALLEGIGITALIPLFSFVSGGGDANDIVSRTIIKVFDFVGIPFEITFVLLLIAFLFIFKAVATYFSKYITDVIRAAYVRNTQLELLRLTLKASWPYLSRQKLGYLEKVLNRDIASGGALLTLISSVTILAVNIIIYVIIAFNIEPLVTLVALGIGAIVFLVFKPLSYKTKLAAEESQLLIKDVAHHINESMIGMKTIKAMSLEDKVVDKAHGFFNIWKKLTIRLASLANLTVTMIQPISVLFILVLFAITYKTSSFEFASFAVVIYSINKIFAYIQHAQTQLHNINAAYPYLRTVIEYEDRARKEIEQATGTQEFSFESEISFSDVSFSYTRSDKPTLTDVTMAIKQGEMIGVIGPSGSGKTTFADLILRLINPDSGSITIDGNDIHTIALESWRNNVGYVSQDIFLINDTIKNNIALYNESLSEEDIIKAAKVANIYDFIMNLPQGFETPVGERGMELSGGQRQRIALARVIARGPDILVLDEATSALDNESQALIQDAIEKLQGEITVIIIAHRPSTVMNADKLIVFENGSIVERGKPRDMVENEGSYFYEIVHGTGI